MWDLRYRPLLFSDVLGQEGAVQVLKQRLKNGSALDSSYIFSGGHGQGKTTIARVLARAMLCEHLTEDQEPCNECENCLAILSDTSLAFHERDAASQGTIAVIREIVDELPFVVPGAPKHIHLFDECFTADTLLYTPEGPKDIRTLVEMRYSGLVLSFSPSRKVVWRPITNWFQIEQPREVVRLTFDNGAVLTVTPDQEIHTVNRGWVAAKDLTSEDDVVETTTLDLIDCACGCGEVIPRRGANGKLRRFVRGHQNRGKTYPRDATYWGIRDAYRLVDAIRPHVIPSMAYKLFLKPYIRQPEVLTNG
jgi:hypothetical protein